MMMPFAIVRAAKTRCTVILLTLLSMLVITFVVQLVMARAMLFGGDVDCR